MNTVGEAGVASLIFLLFYIAKRQFTIEFGLYRTEEISLLKSYDGIRFEGYTTRTRIENELTIMDGKMLSLTKHINGDS